MPSKKKSKTEESPYVSRDKLTEAVEVLKKLIEQRNESLDKKPLIEDQTSCGINLQINYKKIPYNKTTFIHMISLPHHWRHVSDFETCLIVKDLNKKPLTDRDLDLDQTKSHYKELLSKDNSDQLVTEILPMRELRNEYKVIEAKQKLSKAFDVFLCERSLLHNKFDYLSRFLGKTFWISEKKVPIPVDLTQSDLKTEIETKLNQTSLYVSGKGDTSLVTIGLRKQSTEHLVNNLMSVLKKLKESFDDNIRSLAIKTNKSMAITFFLDCGFISETHLNRPLTDNQPIEEDFSHFIKSNVQVFKDGNVRVVPKSEEDIDSSEEIDEIETKWLSMNSKNGKRKRSNKKPPLRVNNKRFKRRKTNKFVKQNVDKNTE